MKGSSSQFFKILEKKKQDLEIKVKDKNPEDPESIKFNRVNSLYED